MDTLAIWISVSANAAVAAVLMLRYRAQARRGVMGDGVAKNRYSWLSFSSGFLAAVAVFFTFVSLLDVPTGHGEILIAVPILNAGVSLLLSILGRTIIGWKQVQW